MPNCPDNMNSEPKTKLNSKSLHSCFIHICLSSQHRSQNRQTGDVFPGMTFKMCFPPSCPISGACEYGSFGATLNDGYVSASSFYRNGVGGACYQVRCTDAKYCPNDGVMIKITYSGASSNTDFILSQHAFAKMGQKADLSVSLLSLGAVSIKYRRCVPLLSIAMIAKSTIAAKYSPTILFKPQVL
ncbi:hypothetical protein GW17_00003396 [Ensete ventricosum]|nr:hypothetical protein GW17_00003396 [Ensete ventricosum]